MSLTSPLPVSIHDPINAQILAVSEDRIQGFHEAPLHEIARLSGLDVMTVIVRIRAMLESGIIRRVRQTLLATNLAEGALVAWLVPPEKLNDTFDFMSQQDPFSGHVVIRSTDANTIGGAWRLWTTLKVPQGYSLEKHANYLCQRTGATAYRLMPAKRVFALGVGHVRRKDLEPGARAELPAEAITVKQTELSELEWQVLVTLKREFAPAELCEDLWAARASEANVTLQDFYTVAHGLVAKGVIGRFSTFLEHAKPIGDFPRVTQYNALFHWGVPAGREIEAGLEIGRHFVLTHCYWRNGGPDFNNANIMGVAHGTSREYVLAHKVAIDEHVRQAGIPLLYGAVFWGGRSEIKPSEIVPAAYRAWLETQGLKPDAMRA